jgi:uncharacterized protein (UPF0297 family)
MTNNKTCCNTQKLSVNNISATVPEINSSDISTILNRVIVLLKERGYNPINQLVGYILSNDPTYITTHGNARNMITRCERDDLLELLINSYCKNNFS